MLRKHIFKTDEGFTRYIVIDDELSTEELATLATLLQSFPHAGATDKWPKRFSELTCDSLSQLIPNEKDRNKLLKLAANAYDACGNTMLGVACEYGYDVDAVDKLIDMGAKLDEPDRNMKKAPIYWAINNKFLFENKISSEGLDVLKRLLARGADPEIRCYNDITPYEYAETRHFVAAAKIIKDHLKINVKEEQRPRFR